MVGFSFREAIVSILSPIFLCLSPPIHGLFIPAILIEKFYLFFSLISKPNIYNVSLFFGALSFVSKSILIRTFQLLDQDSFKLKLIYAFLLIGGFEVFFISGVYKENLLFFFLSFIIYAYYSRPRVCKFIVAFLCLLNADSISFHSELCRLTSLSVAFICIDDIWFDIKY